MDDRLIAGLGLVTLAVIFGSVLAGMVSKIRLDQAYEQHIGTQAIVIRNEWGQLRHTPEFMCEASIRQWLKECSK